MKIKQIYIKDDSKYCDNGDELKITFDDKQRFSIGDFNDSAEDARLCRGLSDAHHVFDMLKEVYELGKQGVEVTFEKEKKTLEDDND